MTAERVLKKEKTSLFMNCLSEKRKREKGGLQIGFRGKEKLLGRIVQSAMTEGREGVKAAPSLLEEKRGRKEDLG